MLKNSIKLWKLAPCESGTRTLHKPTPWLKSSRWTFKVSSTLVITVTMCNLPLQTPGYHLLLSTEEFLQLIHLETIVWDLWCYIAETWLVSDLQSWRLHATPSSQQITTNCRLPYCKHLPERNMMSCLKKKRS